MHQVKSLVLKTAPVELAPCIYKIKEASYHPNLIGWNVPTVEMSISEIKSEMERLERVQTETTVVSTAQDQLENQKMIVFLESVNAGKEIMEIARSWSTITPAKLGMLLFDLHCVLEQHRRIGDMLRDIISKAINKRHSNQLD